MVLNRVCGCNGRRVRKEDEEERKNQGVLDLSKQ